MQSKNDDQARGKTSGYERVVREYSQYTFRAAAEDAVGCAVLKNETD
jgi:hypothetical protein